MSDDNPLPSFGQQIAAKGGQLTDEERASIRRDLYAGVDAHPLRQYSPTGGMKDNLDKPPVDLLPTKPLLEIAAVVGYGASKYEPHNWRRGISWSQTLGSIERHLLAWNDGEDLDPETGKTHLAHAAAQLMFLIEYTLTSTGVDDRFSTVGHEGGDSSRGDPSGEPV